MRILFVTFQGGMAGSTYSIAHLARGLAGRGHQVWVACPSRYILFIMFEKDPVEVIDFEFHGKASRADAAKLSAIVREKEIDIVNAQSSMDRYASIWARWFFGMKARLVHTRRQRPLDPGGPLKRWFLQRGTDGIVVISQGLKDTFVEKGFSPKKLQVIYNGLPPDTLQLLAQAKPAELRKRYQLSPGEPVLGCVSREKNQEQIIQALALLPEDLVVLFVGIEESYLAEKIAEAKPKQRIIFAGKLDRAETLAHYSIFDLSVLASTMDGFGLVLVEAMAAKVPVVATRYGGITDVVEDERSGLLFENGDIDSLASQVNRLFEDEELRENLVAEGYRRATETFSLSRTVESYEAYFQGLIAARK